MKEIVLVLTSGLLSGLIGLALSTWFYVSHEERQTKLAVFRTLAGTRYALAERANAPDAKDEFFRALNEAYIVFHDSKEITKTLIEFQNKSGPKEDQVARLFNAISEDLKLKQTTDATFVMNPFTPGRNK